MDHFNAQMVSESLYATGTGNPKSALYKIDPTGGGVIQVIPLNFAGQTSSDISVFGGGLAYDVDEDTLFATGQTGGQETLFTIDRRNGTTAIRGSLKVINASQMPAFSGGRLAISPITEKNVRSGIR